MKQIKQALAGKVGKKHVMLRGVDVANWRAIRSAAALVDETVSEFVIVASLGRVYEVTGKSGRAART